MNTRKKLKTGEGLSAMKMTARETKGKDRQKTLVRLNAIPISN